MNFKCKICGKDFESNSNNAKYCSEKCQKDGRSSTRKAWIHNTNYNEKQRRRRFEERTNKKIENLERELEEATKSNRNKSIQEKKKATTEKNNRKYKLLEEIERGSTEANFIYCLENYGKKSYEYWEAFQKNEIRSLKDFPMHTTIVNGIDVYDKDFALKAYLSIEELGAISVNLGYRNLDK